MGGRRDGGVRRGDAPGRRPRRSRGCVKEGVETRPQFDQHAPRESPRTPARPPPRKDLPQAEHLAQEARKAHQALEDLGRKVQADRVGDMNRGRPAARQTPSHTRAPARALPVWRPSPCCSRLRHARSNLHPPRSPPSPRRLRTLRRCRHQARPRLPRPRRLPQRPRDPPCPAIRRRDIPVPRARFSSSTSHGAWTHVASARRAPRAGGANPRACARRAFVWSDFAWARIGNARCSGVRHALRRSRAGRRRHLLPEQQGRPGRAGRPAPSKTPTRSPSRWRPRPSSSHTPAMSIPAPSRPARSSCSSPSPIASSASSSSAPLTVYLDGVAAPGATAMATPLGLVPVD